MSRESEMPALPDGLLGVIEFFAVLMPGALLVGAVALVTPPASAVARMAGGLPPDKPAAWVAFFVLAYTAGHFLFLITSSLDKRVYDRFLRDRFGSRAGYNNALAMKDLFFGLSDYFGRTDDDRDRPMNPFSWAKSVLILRAPGALAQVERYEADSKFFRSLTAAFPASGLAAALLLPDHRLGAILFAVSVGLAALSLWRYGQLRFKATEWAYRYMLVLEGLDQAGRR